MSDSLLSNILSNARDQMASDIHLSTNQPAAFRVNGELKKTGENLTAQDMQIILGQLWTVDRGKMNEPNPQGNVGDDKKAHPNTPPLTSGSIDFGYTNADGERYRVNAYRSLGHLTLALRHLANTYDGLAQLHLPPAIAEFTKAKTGLVLICGATGSGKSTTLAALLQQINTHRAEHIITIEDPIEFIHTPECAVIHQRELGRDFIDFSKAVRAALREDPDVLMIGEMRDLETIRAALTAAETGHLVFSTLHTNDACSAIERLIGAFPGNEQDLSRVRLARCLRAVVAQQLIPTSNGLGRVPAVEVLLQNSAVSNLIESDKTKQLYAAIESNRASGMQTLDQSLADLVHNRWITREQAQLYAKHPQALAELITQAGVR